MAYISRCVPDLLPAHLGSIPTKNGMAISAGAMEMTPNNPSPPSAAATDEAAFEAVARMIDPSSWRVFDSYLADVKRKYKGQDAGYDPEAFKDKKSLALAREIAAFLAGRSSQRPSPKSSDPERECELAVGRFIYNRAERLMDATAGTPEGAELTYLAGIIADVEEYGADGTEGRGPRTLSASRPSPSVGREEIAADKELVRLEKFADEAEVRARQGFGYTVPLAAMPGFARRLRSVVQSVRDYRAAVERLTVAQGRAWDEGAAIGRQLERDALAQPATVAVEGEEPTERLEQPGAMLRGGTGQSVGTANGGGAAVVTAPTLPAGEWTDEQVEAAARALGAASSWGNYIFAFEREPDEPHIYREFTDELRKMARTALATITPTAGGRPTTAIMTKEKP